MGVGLILATATTFFTDIKYLYGVLVMLLSFMTPLFYPIDIIPQQFLFAYKLNPLYSAVECFRNIILGGTFPDLAVCVFNCNFNNFTYHWCLCILQASG